MRNDERTWAQQPGELWCPTCRGYVRPMVTSDVTDRVYTCVLCRGIIKKESLARYGPLRRR